MTADSEKIKYPEVFYRFISENSNDLIAVFNHKNEYEYINETQHKRILGYNKEDLIGKSLADFIHPEILKEIREQVESGLLTEERAIELQIRHQNGSYLWIESRTKLFKDENGKRKAIVISRDITENKKTIDELKTSEKKVRQVIENANEGIWIIDETSINTYVNQQMADILGYDGPEEFIGRSLFSFLDEDQKNFMKYHIERRRRGLKDSFDFKTYRKDGKKIFLRIKTSPIFNDHGEYIGAFGFISDITDQNIAEQRLRESEEQFKLMTEQSILGIIILQDGVIKYANQAAEEISGYSVQEMMDWIPNGFARLIHPEDVNIISEEKQLGKLGATLHVYCRMISKARKIKWISQYSKTVIFQGKIAELITLIDITEQKNTEDKLRESEEKFKIIAEQNLMGIIILQEGQIKYVNQAAANIIEYEIMDLKNWSIDDYIRLVHPDDASIILEQARKKQEGDSDVVTHYSYRLFTKSGQLKWISLYSKSIWFQGTWANLITIIDITERKLAEEKQKEADEKFKMIAEQSQMGIAILQDDLIKYANEGLSLLSEFSIEEFLNWKSQEFAKFIYHEDSAFVMEQLRKKQIGESDVLAHYYTRFLTKSGKLKWGSIYSKTITYEGRNADLVTIVDITERKNAEEEAEKSRARLKYLLSASPAVIYSAKPEGEYPVTYISENVKSLTGYEPYQFTDGSSFWIDHVHAEDRKLAFKAINQLFKQNRISNEYRFKCKDGNYIWVLDSMELIYNIDGKPIEIVGYWANITARKHAENALRESEEQYRRLIETMNDGFTVIEPDGTFSFINDKLIEMLGYSRDEMIGKPWNIFFDNKNRKIVKKHIAMRERGVGSAYEVAWKKKDGKQLFSIISGKPILDVNGAYTKSFAVITDISDRKYAEEQLRESEERYRFIAENMDDIIAVLNKNMKIEYVNEALEKVAGFTFEAVRYQTATEFVHPDDYPRALGIVDEGLRNGKAAGEFRIKRKDGTFIWIEVKGKVITDENNELKIILVSRDIDLRKKLEQELKDSEELYRTLLKTSPDAITATDLGGTITTMSERALKLNRCDSIEELRGKNAFELIHPSEREWAMKNLQRTLSEGFVENLEYMFLRKDGTSFIGELSAALVKDSSGKPKGFISTVRDITERKEAEEKLKKSEERYREAYNRAEFYKDLISHDVTNILQNIVFCAESGLILLDEKEKLKEKLLDIKDQVKRSGKLISNVRKLSKLEKEAPMVELTEVNQILSTAIEYIERTSRVREVKIQVEAPEKKLYIQGNELLRDVFENILQNAVRYNQNPIAEILIKISNHREGGLPYLKMEFIDNGTGIKELSKWAIFNRGFREDGNVGGRGLGLSLAKQIVNSYEGQIWVEDKIQGDYTQGSNFIIMIPEAIHI